MNFAERREVERWARGSAFQTVGLTPERAVDRASISAIAGTSLEGTASPSMTPQVQVSRTLPPPRLADGPKGKEPAVSPSKRTREGNELELPRKRLSQGIKLTDSVELRDMAPTTAQALVLPSSQGEGSSGCSFFPWMREGFKLMESRRDLESLALEIKQASPPLSNLQLSNSWVGRPFGKTMLHSLMDHDLS